MIFVFHLHVLQGGEYEDLICDYCKKDIIGRYIIQEKNVYHELCYKDYVQLRCDHCNETISGSYNIDKGNNYHNSCFRENILEKCDVCFQPIDGEYVKDIWNNIYHNYHRANMPLCESCNRLISSTITNGGYAINNRRNICNLCWEHTINNTFVMNQIYDEIHMQFTNLGIENIPKSIPIILIDDKNELNRIADVKLSDGIQGYTKYDYQKIGSKKINERFTIYILSNLHKLNFKAVLAHELLHVYLFKNNIRLSASLIEGFCNLGSGLIYSMNIDDKISQLKLQSMMKDNHPEYGKGFRLMNAELEEKGWQYLIKNLENY